MTPKVPCPRPGRVVLEGRYARLEPLSLAHADGLMAAAADASSFDYLFDVPPRGLEDLKSWIRQKAASDDPLFHAVIDKATGVAGGRQTFMRITPEHGVIEIGNILWGPAIARTRVATEALVLAARHVFEDLGYRRFEWKCNDRNEPSKKAALRFGFTFEGVFRQHMWAKGANRDTAWFSMLDHEWPRLRQAYERWLDPANFDAAGRQRARLAAAP
ncbi:MAG: GNAT family N-acetyltransferase [Betaproteobacteria bacterium]|nr:GNAT family N-acetyltransferase [Betaproteobacteria bacterium]MDH5221824.1 GNAT family N-acetyltransferase [Betaproteobacteria bacterium]MDH5350628.1 GNAT family N-acetyltransferase [Betaproteobacteria bacterium]